MIDPNAYPVLVRPLGPAEGGGFLATVPDLPGCTGDGDSEAAAIADARAAIVEWAASVVEDGGRVPEPGGATQTGLARWQVRAPRSLHRALTERAEREGVSLNSLVTTLLAGAVGFDGQAPAKGAGRKGAAARSGKVEAGVG